MATGPSGLRTYRVSRVEAIELTAEPAWQPDGFDLRATWEELQQDFTTRLPPAQLAVELLVEPQTWQRLSGGLGAWWDLVDLGPEVEGRRRVRAHMDSAARAAAELVGFSDNVDVVSPPEVRGSWPRSAGGWWPVTRPPSVDLLTLGGGFQRVAG